MTRTKASPLAVWLRINILWQSNQRRHAPQRMGMSRRSSLSHPGQMSFPVLGNWWLHFISRSLWALQPTQNTGLIFSVSLSISSPTSSYTLALLGPRKIGSWQEFGMKDVLERGREGLSQLGVFPVPRPRVCHSPTLWVDLDILLWVLRKQVGDSKGSQQVPVISHWSSAKWEK